MALWEREIFPYEDELEHLTPASRLRIAVEAIDWTLQTTPTPIQDQQAAEWIEATMTAARAAVAQGSDRVPPSEDLIDRFEDVDDEVYEEGVGQLAMGVNNFWSFETMTSKALEGVLFACYEFFSMREDPEPETIEEEQANTRCREVIAYQKELISTRQTCC